MIIITKKIIIIILSNNIRLINQRWRHELISGSVKRLICINWRRRRRLGKRMTSPGGLVPNWPNWKISGRHWRLSRRQSWWLGINRIQFIRICADSINIDVATLRVIDVNDELFATMNASGFPCRLTLKWHKNDTKMTVYMIFYKFFI